VLYTSRTDHKQKEVTTCIKNASEGVIATLEWRSMLPDRVRVGQAKRVWVWSWMKRNLFRKIKYVYLRDDKGKGFMWKGKATSPSLVLYSSDDGYTTPIATYHRRRRQVLLDATEDSLNPVWTPSTLIMSPRAIEIQDLVVTSLVFLEKNQRVAEQITGNGEAKVFISISE